MRLVCIVTGASSGIGKATAIELARRGASLVLGGRNETRLNETASACREHGIPTEIVAGPVENPQTAERLAEKLAAVADSVQPQPGLGGEPLTNVITLESPRHNEQAQQTPKLAGVFAAGVPANGPTLDFPNLAWENTLAANLTGLFYTCREAIRAMLPRGGGRIVNVISTAAIHPFSEWAAYVASKAGALALTRSLAAEFRQRGIRLTAFLPGSTDTPLWEGMGWRPETADMLTAHAVANAIADIVTSPIDGVYDEVHFMPQKGVL